MTQLFVKITCLFLQCTTTGTQKTSDFSYKLNHIKIVTHIKHTLRACIVYTPIQNLLADNNNNTNNTLCKLYIFAHSANLFFFV